MKPVLKSACACALVFGVSLLPYLQTGGFDFVNLDDYNYVHSSPVAKGLSGENLKWALTDAHTMSNWHPLTYLSLMSDVTFFGLKAGPMHLHNAVLHAVDSVLLFLFLVLLVETVQRLGRFSGSRSSVLSDLRPPTSVLWACVFAALFWSLHPLRTESVAWISSRKDVLSAFFCFLGLLAHVSDVRRWWGGRRAGDTEGLTGKGLNAQCSTLNAQRSAGGGGREAEWRKLADGTDAWVCSWRWWLGLGCFALGCMAKPTMMVFPAFVALIEWLVSGRVRWKALSVYAIGAVCVLVLTISAQAAGGAMHLRNALVYRVLNAAVSISAYVGQLVLPRKLAAFYPYDANLSAGAILGGLIVVAGLIGLAAWGWRRAPAVTCGVLWFLAALAPVLGLIQVGDASRADRYTYLATVGISLMLAKGFQELLNQKDKRLARLAAVAGLVAVAALGAAAWRQAGYWREDPTLFKHALAVSRDNYLAYRYLGLFYYRQRHNCSQAAAYFDEAFRINREDNRQTQLFYIAALAESGALERAKEETRDMSEFNERKVIEAMNRGEQLGSGGKPTRVLESFQAYAIIAYCEGDKTMARQHAGTVLGYCPNDEYGCYVLGLLERDEGHLKEAVSIWRRGTDRTFVTLAFLLPMIEATGKKELEQRF